MSQTDLTPRITTRSDSNRRRKSTRRGPRADVSGSGTKRIDPDVLDAHLGPLLRTEAVIAGQVFPAIAQLPESFRLALVAVDIAGLSYGEAARVLGAPEATITTRLYRARQRVARELDPERSALRDRSTAATAAAVQPTAPRPRRAERPGPSTPQPGTPRTSRGRHSPALAGNAQARGAVQVTRMDEAAPRAAVVTGVGRRQGIGFAIARRLLADGLNVVIQSWSPHDAGQSWAPEPGEQRRVIEELGGLGARLDHVEADFADPEAPRRVIDHAVDRFGAVDVLIANHAMHAPGRLTEVSAADLDSAWAVNARGSVLLVQAYADHHDDSRPDGRVLLFTSGQHRGPMADELPYAISKGAVHQMTASLADALADRSITVNAGRATR